MSNTSNKLNVDKLMQVLSDILSEKYGCKITMTAIPKEEYYAEQKRKAEEANQKAS